MTAILVAHLRPADDRDQRTGGVLEDAHERQHLTFEQSSCRARKQVRNALDARVCTVRRSERVVDVDVGQLRERTGQLRGVCPRRARQASHQ